MIGSTLKIVNTNTMASMAEDNRKNNMSSELAIDKLMIGSSPIVIFLTFLLEFVIVTERRDRNSGTFYFIVVQSEI